GEADFFTALGDDDDGRAALARLQELGVDAHVAWRAAPQRRAVTHLDAEAERTITIIGRRLAPEGADALAWERLRDTEAVYFTAGDLGALRHARAARVLVATPRARDALLAGEVPLDALVGSAEDEGERLPDGALRPPPGLEVATQGAQGGRYVDAEGRSGSWQAAPLPGEVADAYGCGDSFAAGLTYGLATVPGVDDALELAARCGAACLTGHGPYERQLELGR
ncbi:MAG: PfkB family carbohydrate kinase, partial [Solirubrobacteraceae bacterium]